MSTVIPPKVGVFNMEAYHNLQQAAGYQNNSIAEWIQTTIYEMEKGEYDFICLIHRPLMNLSLHALENSRYSTCTSGCISVVYNNKRFTQKKTDPENPSIADTPSIDVSFEEVTTRKCMYIGLTFFMASLDPGENLEMLKAFRKDFAKKELAPDENSPTSCRINLLDEEDQEVYFDTSFHLFDREYKKHKEIEEKLGILAVMKQTINTHIILQIFGENCFFETLIPYASLIEPRLISLTTNEDDIPQWEETLVNNPGHRGILEVESVRIAQFKCF